jgi:hypothetical protein
MPSKIYSVVYDSRLNFVIFFLRVAKDYFNMKKIITAFFLVPNSFN